MVILEDTRQKKGKHDLKENWFAENDVMLFRSKLFAGDYCLPPAIAVDTKQNLMEIAGNICGNAAERKRFREECKAAQTAGCKLVFLVEHGKTVKEAADLIGRKIKLGNGRIIQGDQLFNAMAIIQERYGCSFEFCAPECTGQRIKEILENGQ